MEGLTVAPVEPGGPVWPDEPVSPWERKWKESCTEAMEFNVWEHGITCLRDKWQSCPSPMVLEDHSGP